ncbi:hypothetical protein [Lacticaseibacillus sharpeae]|nr:hypothetical protein [Lacticaseibacillus sharpeae]
MTRKHIYIDPLYYQPLTKLRGGMDPQALSSVNIPGFAGIEAAQTVTDFMTVILRQVHTGDVGDALLNLVTAHALTGVDNQMSVSAELVTVCTTLPKDSANLPILARNPQFLRMFVHNYGQKRLDALILGLILPQIVEFSCHFPRSCRWMNTDGQKSWCPEF